MLDSDFILSTNRLNIRFLTHTDYKIWKSTYLNLDDKQSPWDVNARDPSQVTKSVFKNIIDQQKKNRDKDCYYDFVVFNKSETKILGYASLMDITRGIFQNAYLGYGVFNNYWAQGYGQEIVNEVINIAFLHLNLHRVEAGIDELNDRSINLALKVGLKLEGISRKRLYLSGLWKDICIYAMTCEERGYTASIGDFSNHRH